MKIKKDGEEVLYIKRCVECGHRLIYDEYDLKIDKHMNLYIKCLVCGKHIPIGFFQMKYNPIKHGKLKEG